VKQDGGRINTQIEASSVRVIDEEGQQLGILKTSEALAIAEERGYDLVEVSGKSDPPVCRIMDYGKYKYQQSKKLHDAKRKQAVVRIKEIKLRPKTEEHDFQFKVKHARGFLQDGNKVKVTCQYRGREMAFTQLGLELLERFAEAVDDLGIIETHPHSEGRSAQMILGPKKQA